MDKRDNILIWVNNDIEEKYQKHLDSFLNKLNLYPTRLYIDGKNVHYLNTAYSTTTNHIIHNRRDSKSILHNKIMKLSPIFILTITKHNNVNFSKNTTHIINLSKSLNIPVLVIPTNLLELNLDKIITTIDFKKQSKERIAWANFWGKKIKAKIEVFYPNEKDDYIVEDINANIFYTKKLFIQSENRFNIISTNSKSEKNTDWAIKKAEENAGCLLLLSTSNFNLLPQIFKPKEIKLLNKCRKIPLFLIPPNHDYTIPCH